MHPMPDEITEETESVLELPGPDKEWQARHGAHLPNPMRKHAGRAVAIFILIFVNLGVGLVGGVAGFVTLSNSNSAWAQSLRKTFKIGADSELRVPVLQDIKLEESSAVIDAAKKVSPAVVSVTANAQVVDFFGQSSSQEISGGTGFIITSDGLIVTNKHVVSEKANYKVVLSDGRVFDATIKAVDPLNDFAVLKIEAKDLPTVELGSSDALQIGQSVIAVGNALGEFQNSVTLGVVSAKNRTLDNVGSGAQSESLNDLLQTDAAINPGNSGGPLVNLAGQVVGINTAIASDGVGVGFALAIDGLKNVIDSVRTTGEIVRPYIGIRYQMITKALQQTNSLSVDHGALISRGTTAGELAVIPGGPGDKAGLLENDIIESVNGEELSDTVSLASRLAKYKVGDTIELKVLRKGAEVTVKVTLDKMPTTTP